MSGSDFDAGSQSRTDEEIIAAIRGGDANAWGELVHRYERLVMSIPRSMGLAREDAEEVFQATWTTLYEHLQNIRNPGRIVYWIRTTARRESWRKGQERTVDTAQDSELEVFPLPSSDCEDPGSELDRRETRTIVMAGLNQLDTRCRLLLTNLFLHQTPLSYDDLGVELGIPLGSVGPTRIRCLEKLAQILGARGTED